MKCFTNVGTDRRREVEATLFALAGQLERAQPWHTRRPPLSSSATLLAQ